VSQLVKRDGIEKTTQTIDTTIFVLKFMNYKTPDLTTDHLSNAGISAYFGGLTVYHVLFSLVPTVAAKAVYLHGSFYLLI
jgi:hypothetical protein